MYGFTQPIAASGLLLAQYSSNYNEYGLRCGEGEYSVEVCSKCICIKTFRWGGVVVAFYVPIYMMSSYWMKYSIGVSISLRVLILVQVSYIYKQYWSDPGPVWCNTLLTYSRFRMMNHTNRLLTISLNGDGKKNNLKLRLTQTLILHYLHCISSVNITLRPP